MPDSVEKLSPLAGKPAPKELLVDVDRLIDRYFARVPDTNDPAQLVSFGTSGHRGSPLRGSFNEAHILAISQAICEYRASQGTRGPLYIGKDTHAVSSVAQRTALQVLAANGVSVIYAQDDGITPTPVISHAILEYNRQRSDGRADGIVVTPSHNPPEDGGFKYDPPHGGPAEPEVTTWIQNRANDLMRGGNAAVKRVSYDAALATPSVSHADLMMPYVRDLRHIIDFEVIRESGLRIGVDPFGGASLPYWNAIVEEYGIHLDVVNTELDPAFGFMTVDHDGKIRTDPSSPYCMQRLVEIADEFDLAFACDADADRHGIVTRSAGLLNPNHYLAVAISYLLEHRRHWRHDSAVGKTLVSSAMIDRVVNGLGRKLSEVPVGFKWFVEGLFDGSYCFGGEESAGASFLRMNGTVWTTDKDGLIMGLLAAEIMARTGKDPGAHYHQFAEKYGTSHYARIDAPGNDAQRAALASLSPDDVAASELAGEPILAKLTRAPGNDAPIGGLKVVTANGWFAARPSGTEPIYKIYAESFKSKAHLEQIIAEAKTIVLAALK